MADEPIRQIFEIDDSQAIAALERILELTDNASRSFEELDEEQQQTFQELARSLGVSEKEFNSLIQKTGQYEKEIKDASRQTSAFTDEVKKSIRQIRIMGVSVGDVVDLLGRKVRVLRSVVTGLGAGSRALKIFRAALISTGVGALLVALGSLATLLTKTQRGIDFVNRVLAVMGSVIDNVIERLAILGEVVVLTVTGKFGQAFDRASDAVSGFGRELVEDAKAADQLELASQRLQDRQIELTAEFERTRQRIEELRLIAQDETKSRREQQEALREAIRLEEDLGNKRIELVEEELRITRERNALGESLREDLQREADLEAQVARIRSEVARRQRELVSRQGAISRQRSADAEKQQKEIEGLIKDLQDVSAAYEGQEAVARRSLQLQIDKLRELRQAVADAGVGEQFSEELQNVDNLIEALQRRLREGTVDALESLPTIQPGDIVTSETAQSFEDAGEALGRAMGQGLKDETIKLTDEQKSFLRDQFLDIFTSITDIFVQNTERQIQAQQRVIDARQTAVDDLERQLAEEQRLQEQGFANNAGLIEQSLKDETRLLEQEQNRRLELERKAARERLIINSLQQVAETTTAVVRLLSQGARGFIPGLIAAAAGVALLFRIISQARSQAQQFAQVPTFREGTPELVGPSHERGGIFLEAEGGERILSKRLNAQLGGRTLSNDELVETYGIGKRLQEYLKGDAVPFFQNMHFLPAALQRMKENQQAAEEMKLEQHTRRLEEAYHKASEKAANRMIEYWKTRPVTKPTKDGERTEWMEGRTLNVVNVSEQGKARSQNPSSPE